MTKYAQGKFRPKNPDKYIGGSMPTYRSSWEFHFMKFCDENPSIYKWASEAIKIPYRNPFTGKQTIYVPDFFIHYVDQNGKQKTEVIEIKPEMHTLKEKTGRNRRNQLHWALNQVKWEAARNWCKSKGIAFRIITEKDMFHTGNRR